MPRAVEAARNRSSWYVGTETWIQAEVAVRCVKARVIEDVKELSVEAQFKPLGQVEVLEKGKIETRLERSTESVSSSTCKSRFREIASSSG